MKSKVLKYRYHKNRESLYDILIKFGVPKKLVRLIKTYLDRTQSKVRIGNCLLVFRLRTV